MTSIEGNVTLEHPKPGPHSELYSCRCGCIKFQHLVLHCRALATHRDHLDRGSGRVHVICWQPMCEKEREMTDSLARLSAATRFPLQLLSCPGIVSWFLQTSARLRYCFGGQLNCHLTERLQGKSPERKQKWSKGPFPRCSWLLSAPEDLSEHFQNKEFVCVGARIANPRIYAHLHKDRETLALGNKKCYSHSYLVPIWAAVFL